ncbi:MAG: 4-hydroxythreonine-4-phosphate dehydrogenase PdxA [Bacilli bacterium]
MLKAVVAVTMGDPAGIGPEICILALCNRDLRDGVNALLFGDLSRLEKAKQALVDAKRIAAEEVSFRVISSIQEARFDDEVIQVVNQNNVPLDLPWGQIDSKAGMAAFSYLSEAVKWAKNGDVEAVCTAPIHKEAWKLANIPFPGHTEALAELTGAKTSAMMLVNCGLRVVHVTTHVSLRQAIDMLSKERVLEKIVLTHESLQKFGIKNPRIAVAGINPHAGEGGLFGDEENLYIHPAVKAAEDQGINIIGPLPPDSVYSRAAGGEFDAVIAMYHDQGHIAIKMLGFDTGINVTLGLPILRTSVDHGTAFDIAGKGIAREDSMITAVKVAVGFLSVSK